MRSRHMATVAKRRSGDWYHLEVAPKFAHDPEATKQAFQAVFGVSPQGSAKTCLGWLPTRESRSL
jgi:hypothetical protein